MKLTKVVSALVATAAIPSAAMAQWGEGPTYLGVDAGFYMPQNSEIRDIFGSSIFRVGFNVGSIERQADKWRLTGNFQFITARNDDNRFFLLPVTAAIGTMFGKEGDMTRPYVRFGAGFAYADYSIEREEGLTTERHRGSKFIPTANAEVGLLFGDRFRLAASYFYFGETDDFDFSGFQITATYNFVKF